MRRTWTASLVLLLAVAACSSDPAPGGQPWPPAATDRSPAPDPDPISFSKADLRRALVGIDDIPRSHGTDFADFVIDRDALPGSESVVSGAPECGEYLDDEFASTPVTEVSRAYADPVSGVTVLHTIAHHEPDGADDELEEIRYLLSECDRFRMVQAGSEVEVATDLAELDHTPGYEDLGDDGVRVGLLVIMQDVPFRATSRTIVRVGDLVGTLSIEAFADFGRDPSPELTALMVERLQKLVEEAA